MTETNTTKPKQGFVQQRLREPSTIAGAATAVCGIALVAGLELEEAQVEQGLDQLTQGHWLGAAVVILGIVLTILKDKQHND